MKTVSKYYEAFFEEKKSKFIGYIKPVKTKEEAIEFIEEIKKKHYDATHNVYAYKVFDNNIECIKFSDDGEPQNTAGKPVFEIINIMDIANVVIVVTRYFGGIKLGAGGLVRNYAKAAKFAVEGAGIEEYREKREYVIDFPYSKISQIEKIINDNKIEIKEKIYEERITFRLLMEEKEKILFVSIDSVIIF